MKDRIIKFLTHENLTATKFADEIGVQRSSVSHILSGRNNPSFEFIQKILNRYKYLSAEWLIQGSGLMLKKTQNSITTSTISDSSSSPEHSTDQLNLFNKNSIENKQLFNSGDKIEKVSPKIEIQASAKVEKIVVFYSDKTFDEFLPSK
jgi:transcriptional regulator with XRE-family HTH domain